MEFKPQLKIPATYMRGGTSKGVFFNCRDLPEFAQQPGDARDQLLMRIVGSPDPYGQQIDGLGNATSSTSKAVIIDNSQNGDHDVNYTFGQVAIDKPFIDWSGNCGNLTAAVGAFAINNGYINSARIPTNGSIAVKIWQTNIQKTIVTQVPIANGEVQEMGEFVLDGVAFPAAEIPIEFLDPADGESALFPTGNIVDKLVVPGVGNFDATFINSGIPTIFLRAADLGFSGVEAQADINSNKEQLNRLEAIRAHGAVQMGLINDLSEAATRQHTPKIAWVSPAQDYTASSGNAIAAVDINLCVRAMSMGKLHHAMMGTASVAIASAAAVPGTLVNEAAGGGECNQIVFGHPSGSLKVGAAASLVNGKWGIDKVTMSRSARVIMEGWVRAPFA